MAGSWQLCHALSSSAQHQHDSHAAVHMHLSMYTCLCRQLLQAAGALLTACQWP